MIPSPKFNSTQPSFGTHTTHFSKFTSHPGNAPIHLFAPTINHGKPRIQLCDAPGPQQIASNPNGKGINSNFVPPNTLFKGIPKELHRYINFFAHASYFGKGRLPLIDHTNSLNNVNSSKK